MIVSSVSPLSSRAKSVLCASEAAPKQTFASRRAMSAFGDAEEYRWCASMSAMA